MLGRKIELYLLDISTTSKRRDQLFDWYGYPKFGILGSEVNFRISFVDVHHGFLAFSVDLSFW